MGLGRIYRLIESSLVALFFLQASRVVFAALLSTTNVALANGQVDLMLVYAHLMLIGAIVLPWFAPRSRAALPETLSITAILISLARVMLTVQVPMIRLAAGLLIVGVGGVYFTSLVRANWRTLVSTMVVGITFDQLLRARDTYDISLRTWLDLLIAGRHLLIPWIVVQAVIAIFLIVVSRLARRTARSEPYEPGFVSAWGGLSLGGFLALETLVLGMPNVVARWTGVAYAGLVPWLILVTALPLLPAVRRLMGETLAMFDDRLRGLVWLFALLMLIVVGNRLAGLAAAGALIFAQFMAVLLLWWMPSPPDPVEVEQSGPSVSLGLAAFALLTYAYSLTFEYALILPWLKNQALSIILVAATLSVVPRMLWREEDPWLLVPAAPEGIAMTFVAPVAVLGLILSGLNVELAPPPFKPTLRVATYNINGGYDDRGVFQLEFIARTIEASLADVVILQEVDAGRPVSYGIDEVQYLAWRLGMYQAYVPTAEHVRGLAILSRWPLSSRATATLPGIGEQRASLRALIEDPSSERSVTVIGAQLSDGPDEDRVEQLAVLLGFVGDSSPLVLGADLAGTPQDFVYQQLVANSFVDPDVALGIEQGYTTPARNPSLRHDYVLVRNLVPLDSRQVDSTASDHRLVVIEVGWPGN